MIPTCTYIYMIACRIPKILVIKDQSSRIFRIKTEYRFFINIVTL